MDIAPSNIKAATYVSHFGTWHKALEAFVVRMNQDERELEQTSGVKSEEKTHKHEITKRPEVIKQKPYILTENRREIGLGLRYKILSRDKFKCVRCGVSPAVDHTCQLHVDHKVPFSKGGRTILENLHTLCENCNLGKGNRHLE